MSTIKQIKAIKRLPANKGNVSKSMRDAGYSKASAHNPRVLTQSKTYKEILKKAGITDTLAAKIHKKYLTVPRIITTKVRGEVLETTEELDPTGLKALDLFYKVSGKYKYDPNADDEGPNETLESINTLIKMLNAKRDTKLLEENTITSI